GDRQPQCFSSTVSFAPNMSAAGLLRVKVTQRKLLSVFAVNSASSTMTSSGSPSGQSRSPIAAASFEAKSSRRPSKEAWRGPATAKTPGKQSRAAPQPSGRDKLDGVSRSNSRFGGPTAAKTTFDPLLRPPPE